MTSPSLSNSFPTDSEVTPPAPIATAVNEPSKLARSDLHRLGRIWIQHASARGTARSNGSADSCTGLPSDAGISAIARHGIATRDPTELVVWFEPASSSAAGIASVSSGMDCSTTRRFGRRGRHEGEPLRKSPVSAAPRVFGDSPEIQNCYRVIALTTRLLLFQIIRVYLKRSSRRRAQTDSSASREIAPRRPLFEGSALFRRVSAL